MGEFVAVKDEIADLIENQFPENSRMALMGFSALPEVYFNFEFNISATILADRVRNITQTGTIWKRENAQSPLHNYKKVFLYECFFWLRCKVHIQ